MEKLKESVGAEKFQIIVLGEAFGEIPQCFLSFREKLADVTLHWGYAESREAYFGLLQSADIVVSTACHEFFGVSIMEAVLSGCYPLCPNDLVYPEYLPKDNLFNTPAQLVKKLKQLVLY